MSHRFFKKSSRPYIDMNVVVPLLTFMVLLSSCASPPPTIDESLRDSALQGDVEAQYQIGEQYYKARYAWFGKGAYWEDAAQWFEMAAKQGDARAHYRLSQYYFNRRQDYAQSFKWLQLPAQQGISEAQHTLGVHYAQAWGTPQNLVLAYKWVALALEGTVSDPKGRVVDLEWLTEGGEMTPEQIREGQRLAAEHTAAYGKSRPLDPGRRTLLEYR